MSREFWRTSNAATRGLPSKLLPLVYEELRKLAAVRLAQEKPGQTLQATALVHDAYLRWWTSRRHSNGIRVAIFLRRQRKRFEESLSRTLEKRDASGTGET